MLGVQSSLLYMDVYLAGYGDPPTNLPSGVIVVDATCFYSQASYDATIVKGNDRGMTADFVRLRMILALFGLERDGSALSTTTKQDVRLAPYPQRKQAGLRVVQRPR